MYVLWNALETIHSDLDEVLPTTLVLKKEINGIDSLSFTLPPSHPYYNSKYFTEPYYSTIIMQGDNKIREEEEFKFDYLFRGVVTSVKKDFFGNKTINCCSDSFLLTKSILPYGEYSGTIKSVFETIMQNHNNTVTGRLHSLEYFEIGDCEDGEKSNMYIVSNWDSSYERLKTLFCDNRGYTMIFTPNAARTKIDMVLNPFIENSQVIKLGENLLDYTSNLDGLDLCSVVIPLGDVIDSNADTQGLNPRYTLDDIYIEDIDISDKIGRRWKAVVFDGVKDKNTLRERGEKYLTSDQFDNVYITVKAVDLGVIYPDKYARFDVFDKVRIISAPHGMDKWFVCTSITRNMNDPSQNIYTFGSIDKNLTSSVYKNKLDATTYTNDSSPYGVDTTFKTQDGKTVTIKRGTVKEVK